VLSPSQLIALFQNYTQSLDSK